MTAEVEQDKLGSQGMTRGAQSIHIPKLSFPSTGTTS